MGTLLISKVREERTKLELALFVSGTLVADFG